VYSVYSMASENEGEVPAVRRKEKKRKEKKKRGYKCGPFARVK
jgi:hypothetical protein